MIFNGEPITICIDDYVPCPKNKDGPSCAQGINNEIWVILMEKAWAKLHGDYVRII